MRRRLRTRAPLSRRRFLQKSAVAAAALVSPLARLRVRAAASLTPVSMTLDWIYQGPNAGFVVALENGFYREAGLDVSITPGKGSGSTAQLVASKATQIGFADGYVVGNGVAKGMAIKTVGSIFRRNPTAMIVLADSPIQSPKDIEGKSIGITAGSAQFQQWVPFCKGAGIDASKVDVVNIDPAGVGAALLSGKVPAVAGFAQGHVPGIEIRGNKDVRMFYFADYGVNVVSNGIIVHEDLLKSDPQLIRAFVTAGIKGFLHGRKHPDEAVAAVKKYLETVDNAITQRELELSWKNWLTPNTMGKPLGWESELDWAATVKVLKEYGGVTAPLEASALYTNDFVPTGPDFVPPQEA
jgi:NitT/TauT family transport system substrate-binding protein